MAPKDRRSMPGVVRHALTLTAVSALALASAGSVSAAPRLAANAASTNPPAILAGAPATPSVASSLPVLPSKWPSKSLEIGLSDSPGGAAALHASGSYKFRYQYLCGGVNTPPGSGWSTWNTNATFADRYVNESVAAGITPVFIYYQMLQSKPGIDDFNAKRVTESQADLQNLRNTATMKSYWADVRLMFQHLGAYSQTMVIDVEPDLWGYIEQASTADQASSVPAAVASSGDADVAGFANNAAGFAQAFVKLRNQYAPNVLLGYHMSTWGTMFDPIFGNTPLDQIDALADRSAAFELSTGAVFDLSFGDPADRDFAFKQIQYGDGGASRWDAADFARFDRWIGRFNVDVGLRMVLWQTPLGNTKMRAMDNTWGHYQDNHVEWWLGDGAGANLASTVNAGVIALLFGGGADGTTSAADTRNDGVTNPPAIDGNNTLSYSADDDGGYFRHQTNAYYGAGAMPLPATAAIPATPSTYHPMDPARLLDTRNGIGLSGKLTANTPRTFQVTGRGTIPAGAVAVTGNVTVVSPSSSWAVYLGPNPVANPTSSTINFISGHTTGNGLTVTLSSTGQLSATFMSTAGKTTDLVFDVTGFYTPDSSGDTYHPMTPARLVDTRIGKGLPTRLSANTPQTFSVRGTESVPAEAVAVTGNVTAVNSTNSWAVYVGPATTATPGTSTVNFNAGEVAGNNLTVALSPTGTLSATFMSTAGNTTDLVFDVTGYYTADASGAMFSPLTPTRLLDTRSANGISGKLTANVPATFTVSGRGQVPAHVMAVTGNLTVVDETSGWAVYLGPAPASAPTTSTINFVKGDVKGNGLVVALSPEGTLSATYISSGGSTTHLVFDATGYFVLIG